MGGWIGGRGRVSGDVVPIEPGVLAAYGEYDANGPGGRRAILSRHQTPVAEMALAAGGYPSLDALPRGNQLGIIERALAPLGGLDRLFASVTTPHYLARGGYAGVSGDTDFSPVLGRALSALARAAGTPIFVQSGRRTVAEQLALGPSTPGHPVAGPNGPHVRGIAADITPGYSVFGALARRFGLGFTVMPQEPWHIQLLNSVGGLGSVALASVPRVVVRGGGHVGRVVQGALDMARSGANRLLTNAGSIAPLGESSPVSAGGFSKARLAGLWIRAGGPSPIANLMAAIARAESGGNPNAYNPSGATGLWQILGAILPGNLRDPMVNARNAVAKYRTQGLGAWETYTNGAYRSFLTRGGRALKFNGGGYVPQKGLGYVPATQQSIKGYIPGGKGLLKGPAATGSGRHAMVSTTTTGSRRRSRARRRRTTSRSAGTTRPTRRSSTTTAASTRAGSRSASTSSRGSSRSGSGSSRTTSGWRRSRAAPSTCTSSRSADCGRACGTRRARTAPA
jgi:hypothetical protein